ncbi:MAG TPA: shikimate kinase [Anaerolineae bacterium]|nr:shikimate kinase [Anaerolineae bacterium]
MVNIALIGFMGSGKTTIGRIIARRLGYPLIDTDALIETKTGRVIPEIFRAEPDDIFKRIKNTGNQRPLSTWNTRWPR